MMAAHANDNARYSGIPDNAGIPGIAGGPPAPPRLERIRYAVAILTQAGMALGVVAIALIIDAVR